MKIKLINYIFIIIKIAICIIYSIINSQNIYNQTPIKMILKESNSLKIKTKVNENLFSISFNMFVYNNTNLPNLENQNGKRLAKGFGFLNSALISYQSKFIDLSIEPNISNKKVYDISLLEKEDEFSVLNDVNIAEPNDINRFRNAGFKINYQGLSLGYGNWDQWWGPGIHNSLVLSNNAEGFYHYYLSTKGYKQLIPNFIDYQFKYMVSSAMKNKMGANYYLSAWYLNLRNKFIEFGVSRNILSGGYEDLLWNFKDASEVLISNKYLELWDQIYDFYLIYNSPNSGLKIFIELGYPNRTYNGNSSETYRDHAIGSNLGFRKYGAFNNSKIMFGAEYTRLVQSIYYNILPTPNWYDNQKYNYSSFNNRRWAAHSGSDSDDLLLFIGYIDKNYSFKYGLNFERHGVTYHFPPEVKFETRITFTYTYNNTFITVNYENEYFEHYGFVDINRNIWDETFELNSIQRTHTVLLSIEKLISY